MKAKNCLIFGGSGQIGRHLIRKLTKNDYRVTVVTRNIHQKSYIIKTQANAGYIDIVEASIFNEEKIRRLFDKAVLEMKYRKDYYPDLKFINSICTKFGMNLTTFSKYSTAISLLNLA